jgi:hypothetical protein
MKKISTLILALITFTAFAEKVKVSESRENIGGGNNNALVVTLYEVSVDDAMKEFKGIMKDYDAKVSTKGDELFGDKALIKKISNNTIDLWAKAVKVKDGETKFIFAINLGGAFCNSSDHKEQFKVAQEILTNFAVKIQKDAIASQLAAAQKILDKMTDQQKDLEKKNANLNDDIKNWNEKIKKAQDDLKVNGEDQVKKKAEIETQTKAVNVVKDKMKAVE